VTYKYFQFIAYQIPTFGYDLKPFGPGEKCAAVADITVDENLRVSPDPLNRLLRLAAVVNEAYRYADTQADTLKVFVAPEFYFRPATPKNAYSYSSQERDLILEILGHMFVNVKYKHWLIIPGTIIANLVRASGDQYFYNTAPVIAGGRSKLLTAVEKHQPSTIDGVPVTGGIANPNCRENTFLDFYSSWPQQKKRVFSYGGLQFALDICLDHAGPGLNRDRRFEIVDTHRMAKRVASRIHNEEGTEIDLHILTAGGMNIDQDSIAAKVNGYILRADGGPGQTSPIELWKVKKYYKGKNPTSPYDMTTGSPKVKEKGALWLPDLPFADLTFIRSYAPLSLKGNLRIPTPLSSWDPPRPAYFDQAIVVYKRLLIKSVAEEDL
jgi:hypothetical protein